MDVLFKSFLKKESGFTLVEILIVLVIFGIITSLVMVNASALIAEHKLKSSAYQLISHLRYAQKSAITKDTSTKIFFYQKDGHKYNIQISDNNKYKTIKTVSLPKDIKIEHKKFGSDSQVYFTKKGQIRNNGHVTLRNNKGKFLFIYLYKTGRFRISTI